MSKRKTTMEKTEESVFGAFDIKNLSTEVKSGIIVGIFVAILLASVLQFFGAIWFGSFPDALNEPVIPESYWTITLVILGIAGVVALGSLAYEKTQMVTARVFVGITAIGSFIIAVFWWYYLLPHLF